MQENPAYQDDVTPELEPTVPEQATGPGTPPTGGGGRKLGMGCLIAAGLSIGVIVLGLIALGLSRSATPAAQRTLDYTSIGTSAFETALAMDVATGHAKSRIAAETATLSPLPTATHNELATPGSFTGISGASCIPNNPRETGKIVDVVDGDTIKVALDKDGKTYPLRYIGINAAEMHPPGLYFAAEATARDSLLTLGKSATLIKDVSETDRFGRLLRYVIVDNVFVNYDLVAGGYAHAVSYPPDTACSPTFQEVERQASAAHVGLWAAQPTLGALPTASRSGGGEACNCRGPDLNCKDFVSHAIAQACYDYCKSAGRGDIFNLDSDGDGSACETLP